MVGVVVGGLGILVALAILIGVVADRNARDAAWSRIAEARRGVAAQQRANEELALAVAVREQQLDRWAEQLRRARS